MLIQLLASIGLVWIIKDSHIFLKPRTYLKSKSHFLNLLLSCSMCLGFWVGLLVVVFDYINLNILHPKYILYPFAFSAFCFISDSLLDLIQEISFYYRNIRENS